MKQWCKKFDDVLKTKAQKRECGMHRAAVVSDFKSETRTV
jgi:hypothetical protein